MKQFESLHDVYMQLLKDNYREIEEASFGYQNFKKLFTEIDLSILLGFKIVPKEYLNGKMENILNLPIVSYSADNSRLSYSAKFTNEKDAKENLEQCMPITYKSALERFEVQESIHIISSEYEHYERASDIHYNKNNDSQVWEVNNYNLPLSRLKNELEQHNVSLHEGYEKIKIAYEFIKNTENFI